MILLNLKIFFKEFDANRNFYTFSKFNLYRITCKIFKKICILIIFFKCLKIKLESSLFQFFNNKLLKSKNTKIAMLGLGWIGQ